MRKLFYLIAASALLFPACKDTTTPPEPGQQDVPLTGVRFAESAFTVLTVGTEGTLDVVFIPADATNKTLRWESDNEDVISVDGNGVLTAVGEGEATVTITAVDGEHTASRTIVVNDGWLGTVSFRTNKTWTVGTQTWSDAVMATRCLKDDYSGVWNSDDLVIDCRQNGDYGHLFSWLAVGTYAKQLCPEPWRIPTKQEFIDLDIELGGNGERRPADMIVHNYVNPEIWGGEYGGYTWVDPTNNHELVVQSQGDFGMYWGETRSRFIGASLMFGRANNSEVPDLGVMDPQGTSHKNNGYALRCIK